MKARALSICRRNSAVPLLLLILCSSISTQGEGIGSKNEHDEELLQKGRPSWVKSVSALAEIAFPYTGMYLEKARSVVDKANGYLFRPRRPDIDFRGSAEGEEGEKAAIPGDDVDEIGASKLERVREAASMSLEKSKSTLEDSAKLAGDTLHQVTDKIKNKLNSHPQGHRPAEL